MKVLRWLPAIVALTMACARPTRAADLCATTTAPRIVVDTTKHTLALCQAAQETATFSVRLGRGGVGKTKEGDGKTPLGLYPLGAPRKSNHYGIFIPIAYPTADQRHRQGYTGGDIGVHGPPRAVRWLGSLVNTFDSSDGCVGVATDDEINAIAEWVKRAHAGTIEIR